MEKETSGKCAETPTRAKSRTPFSLTLRGKAEGVGRAGRRGGGGGGRPGGPRSSARTHTHAPGSHATGCFGGCTSQEGLRAELSEAWETSGLTMTLLSASNASADPRTGRPPALGAGSPTGRRSPAEGGRGSELAGFPAATLSPAGPALAGAAATRARTGPSCSPAAGSSAPDPRGLDGPGLRPRASLLPENES